MPVSPPPAFGGDRVAVKPDGSLVISSRFAKGWVPRREKDLVHALFPGTCIRWNGGEYEVVRAEALGAGARYVLRAWDPANTIRTIEDYDEASETVRGARRAAEEKRKAGRGLSIPLALVLGDLPAAMQDEMESEYGITASRLTLVSIIPLFIWGVLSLVFALASIAGAPKPPVLEALGAPGLYFFAESLIRFSFTMATGRPIGSFPVVLVAETIRHVSGRGKTAKPRLAPLPIEPSVAERDAYRVREAYLALLSPEEQLDFAERFGFDAVKWGKRSAYFILAFALLGVITGVRSGGVSGWLAASCAGYCVAEQVGRLRRLARGLPAGSIFGILVQPFTRRLKQT